ncbi:MAG: hypothetical protein WBA51_19345 [Erythrobacter sp.]
MLSFAEFAAPFALMLPLLGTTVSDPGTSPASSTDRARLSEESADTPKSIGKGAVKAPIPPQSVSAFEPWQSDLRLNQIRIERRVIVRIGPQRSANRRNMLAALPQRALNTRYKERKTDKCVAVERIAGVQTGSGNRLLLFMQDQKILSINLEKACRARDFYSGFYVERAEDGKLCVDRDKLHSRNGTHCEIDRMMQLVALED